MHVKNNHQIRRSCHFWTCFWTCFWTKQPFFGVTELYNNNSIVLQTTAFCWCDLFILETCTITSKLFFTVAMAVFDQNKTPLLGNSPCYRSEIHQPYIYSQRSDWFCPNLMRIFTRVCQNIDQRKRRLRAGDCFVPGPC